MPPNKKVTPKNVITTARKATAQNSKKLLLREKQDNLFLCKGMAYSSMVISAHVSLASHPQYLPHEIFAQSAPTKIPVINKNNAG